VRAESKPSSGRAVERFPRLCEAVVDRLPLGLDAVVAPTFLGFVVLNGCTFGLDLLLLRMLHDGLKVVLPVAVTVAYACAFMVSYVLNRVLNFRSHARWDPRSRCTWRWSR
jgi:hypothetical protein